MTKPTAGKGPLARRRAGEWAPTPSQSAMLEAVLERPELAGAGIARLASETSVVDRRTICKWRTDPNFREWWSRHMTAIVREMVAPAMGKLVALFEDEDQPAAVRIAAVDRFLRNVGVLGTNRSPAHAVAAILEKWRARDGARLRVAAEGDRVAAEVEFAGAAAADGEPAPGRAPGLLAPPGAARSGRLSPEDLEAVEREAVRATPPLPEVAARRVAEDLREAVEGEVRRVSRVRREVVRELDPDRPVPIPRAVPEPPTFFDRVEGRVDGDSRLELAPRERDPRGPAVEVEVPDDLREPLRLLPSCRSPRQMRALRDRGPDGALASNPLPEAEPATPSFDPGAWIGPAEADYGAGRGDEA